MAKKTTKYYDIIQDKGSKVADVLIYGVIGASWFEESVTARQFVADFQALEKESKRINVRINSPGGSVWDGMAIFNVIAKSKVEIHTYNDGLCASMAAVLLLAVEKEHIHPAKNSLLMLHSPSTCACGNVQDFQNAINVLDKIQKSLVTSICNKTEMAEKEVESNYFDYKDHWLSAQEALDAGFYAAVEDEEAENVPMDASNMSFIDLFKFFDATDSVFSEWAGRIEINNDNSTNFIDMDIKKMTAAYGLPDDSTEEAVLAHIEKREKEIADLTTAKTKAETELATANQTITEKDAEIADLKKKPGAESATANTDTDPKGGEKEEVYNDDFLGTYAELKELTK